MHQKFVRPLLAAILLIAAFVLHANAQTRSNVVRPPEAQNAEEGTTQTLQQKLRGRSFFLLSPRLPASGNVRARRTTADLTFDPFNSTAGYISQGNPMGTGDSAYFPNGISTPSNVTNWIYGATTYIGASSYGHRFDAANGASNAYLAIGGGKVGIGTTNPQARLDIRGDSTVSNANFMALYLTGTQSTSNSAAYFGMNVTPSFSAASGNTLASQIAIQAVPQNTSSGTITAQFGLSSIPQNISTGTVTQQFGLYSVPQNYGTGTVSSMFGNFIAPYNISTGSVSAMYGSYTVPVNLSTGTISTLYGSYIAAPYNAGTISNKYALVTEAGAGNVGIGTAAPFYKLDILGGANRNTLSLTGDGDTVGYAGITINALTTTNIPDNRTAQFKLHMRKDSWYGGDGSGPSFIIESVSRVFGFAAPFIIAPNNDILLNGGQGNSTGPQAMSYGNVGIGDTNPSQKLDVNGVIKSRAGGFMFPDGSVQTTASSGSGAVASVFGRTGAVIANANDYTWAQINKTTSSLADISTRSASDLSSGTLPDARFPATLPSLSGVNLANLNASNIGSGIVPPARLGSGAANSTSYLRGDNTWVGLTSSQWTTSGSDINYATGNVGIGSTSTPTSKLYVTGDGRFTGNLTVDGNLAAKYQDVAEWVPSSGQLPVGTVVILDSTKSNQVTSSIVSYDTRVAGVVSEQPGITLGEKADNKVLVATTGRVRVMVDATKSPIKIGDLLVTSDIPGVAMKSEAVNIGGVQIHRPGTLIGKALEPLEKGSGSILVLLSLQ